LYGDLAAIARKEEKYREAIRLATKSIRIYPRAHTYLALATSFLGLKEYGKAIDMAGRGLALLDDSDPLYPTLEKVIDVSRKWIEYEGDDP
jgi:tetratricopeptide (TPR) repeat protein